MRLSLSFQTASRLWFYSFSSGGLAASRSVSNGVTLPPHPTTGVVHDVPHPKSKVVQNVSHPVSRVVQDATHPTSQPTFMMARLSYRQVAIEPFVFLPILSSLQL